MLSVLIFITAGEQYSIVKKETGNSNDNRLRAGKNFKAIKTVGLVLSICFVTWMPYLILTIVSCYNLTTQCRQGDSKRPIPVARTWVSNCTDFIGIQSIDIHFRKGEFQQAFRRSFHWLPGLQQI